MKKRTVIGIAGGSGSGKSTLVGQITEKLPPKSLTVLRHDAYYHDLSRMPVELRQTENWDHPDALDNELFRQHLEMLISGQSVDQPTYDFKTHSRTTEITSVESGSVILVEGILLLAVPEVRTLMDVRIFVDTPPEERIMRRMIRDTRERGRTLDSVAHQFRSTVRPMHDQFVEPSRRHAHLVVPWDWQMDTEPALRMILAALHGFCQPAE